MGMPPSFSPNSKIQDFTLYSQSFPNIQQHPVTLTASHAPEFKLPLKTVLHFGEKQKAGVLTPNASLQALLAGRDANDSIKEFKESNVYEEYKTC